MKSLFYPPHSKVASEQTFVMVKAIKTDARN